MAGSQDTTLKQLLLDWPVNETFAEADFLLSHSNEDAVKWVDGWPQWQRGNDPFHCLIIYGPIGCGKTHLSHVWQKISDARIITLDQLMGVDLLTQDHFVFVIEDIDEGLENTDHAESLFHLYNWLQEQGGYLLLTAKTHPKNWSINLKDLSSRLLAAEAVKIKKPDDQLLQAIMIKQFSDRQIKISKEVVNYLLPRAERSFESLTKLVHDIDQLSLSEKKKITIPIVKRVLDKMNKD